MGKITSPLSKKANNMNNDETLKKIDAGIRKAVANALLRHKQLGQSIAIWKNGKVVIVPAKKIRVPKI